MVPVVAAFCDTKSSDERHVRERAGGTIRTDQIDYRHFLDNYVITRQNNCLSPKAIYKPSDIYIYI